MWCKNVWETYYKYDALDNSSISPLHEWIDFMIKLFEFKKIMKIMIATLKKKEIMKKISE